MKYYTLLLLILVNAARAAAPLEFATTESGLKYAITERGSGPKPLPGQVVIAHYTGTLPDGVQFDSSRDRPTPFAFTLGKGQVIKGWDEGFALLRVGDKATLIVPPELGYKEKQTGSIPPNSTLRFDVEFIDLKEHALADALREAIDAIGLKPARQRYEELKAAKFSDYYVSESQLNSLGYHYLQADMTAEAIAVFEWNVEQFPESGNVYDSLGEACLKNGQRDLAVKNYRKSLELDPKNANAVKVLAELATSPAPK